MDETPGGRVIVICRPAVALLESGVINPPDRPVIYQLLLRLFGNTNPTRKIHGTLAENGCGKFADIGDAALSSLKETGFTHIWLTGALEQASGTAYPDRPADPPDILKGLAGSPYAIRDYFDVCPDYAVDPDRRLEEFRLLLDRCHAHGFRVIIDFVPNHVARSYHSDIRPELTFGAGDDHDTFFSKDNHFYYLRSNDPGGGPPLKLPTAHLPGCTGLFPRESEYGLVSGNNVVSWSPSIHDWYETVKLNYGHDFTTGRDTSHLPGPEAAPDDVPKTWRTMDAVLAYWQEFGVDGFRVDMAHMVPMEFWHWSIRRARKRNPEVFFSAEAYDNDPAKLTDAHVLDCLLDAGFDAVYDEPFHDALKELQVGGKWANDLDQLTFAGSRFHRSLRYAENHDEVRLANPKEWGGHGMHIGRPVTAALFGLGRGPLMIYSGQEVGEPAIGSEGFCGDNARSTIFDYWSMPELVKWVNHGAYDGGGLSAGQRELHAWYGKLIHVMKEPAFTQGEFYGLNHANKENPAYGRIDGETVSGHWLYSFLRRDEKSGQSFLIIANFHGSVTMGDARIRLPENALQWLHISENDDVTFADRLATDWKASTPAGTLPGDGLPLPPLPPLSAFLIELNA